MNMMTIEQKAQAYDEAIERAKGVIEQNPLMEYLKRGIEYIFPELKEDNGEKIRKALIHFISEQDGFLTAINGISVKDIFAWFEKQGEKPQGKSALEAVKEEKIDNSNKAEPKKHSDEIDASIYTEAVKEQLYGWLKKSLRPQPKIEWSKEDEDAIGMAIIALDDMYDSDEPNNTYAGYSMPFNKAVERLKSLRPQNGYNPYKAVVESISKMVEKYAPSFSNLQDFYDNVKVKCKDAIEYDMKYQQNQ